MSAVPYMIAKAAAPDYRPVGCTANRQNENAQNQQLPLDINDEPTPLSPSPLPTNCFKLPCCRLEVLKLDLEKESHSMMLKDRPLECGHFGPSSPPLSRVTQGKIGRAIPTAFTIARVVDAVLYTYINASHLALLVSCSSFIEATSFGSPRRSGEFHAPDRGAARVARSRSRRTMVRRSQGSRQSLDRKRGR